jgi:hypothetical protein
MRHSRQIALAGVGEGGQKRLAAARVVVPADDFVGEIATRYLAGAGCRELRVRGSALVAAALAVDPDVQVAIDPSIDVDAETTLYPWRTRATSELATGAHLALRLLRGLLREPA